jgi:superfamily II DNA or RNA helicase
MSEGRPILAPHQAELVDRVKASTTPLRLVLSAPPGFGKTTAIAASLSALAESHGAVRFLLITPAALQSSWLGILQRYGLEADVIDAPAYRVLQMAAGTSTNPWETVRGAVTSIDFLKRQDRLAEVVEVDWDIVVLDEAHLFTPQSQRGRVGMALWENVNIPRAIAASATISQADWILRNADAYVIRWIPKQLRDWSGRPLLPDREVRTILVATSPEEEAFSRFLFAALEPLQARSTAGRFVAEVLMRRTGSSLYAIEQSLRRYAAASVDRASVDFDEPDEWSEDEPDEREMPVKNLLASDVVERALGLLEDISQDSKFNACMNLLQTLHLAERSVVIFTDFADTADYLGERLHERGLRAYIVTGKLRLDQRYRRIEVARQAPGVLVLTSAITEGVALGFANEAVHYDLPLTPYGLLQRFGRIERVTSQFSRAYHYILSDGITLSERLIEKMQATAAELEEHF